MLKHDYACFLRRSNPFVVLSSLCISQVAPCRRVFFSSFAIYACLVSILSCLFLSSGSSNVKPADIGSRDALAFRASPNYSHRGGGKHVNLFYTYDEVSPFLPSSVPSSVRFAFRELVKEDILNPDDAVNQSDKSCCAEVPLEVLVPRLTVRQLRSVANQHGLRIPNNAPKSTLVSMLTDHVCETCNRYLALFDVDYDCVLLTTSPEVHKPVEQ